MKFYQGIPGMMRIQGCLDFWATVCTSSYFPLVSVIFGGLEVQGFGKHSYRWLTSIIYIVEMLTDVHFVSSSPCMFT